MTFATRREQANQGEMPMSDRIHELLHRNLQEVFGEGDAARPPRRD